MDSYRAPKKEFVAGDISTQQSHPVPAYDAEKGGADPLALERELVEADRYGSTKRGLKSRHIQLIALGGAIGMYTCLGWVVS